MFDDSQIEDYPKKSPEKSELHRYYGNKLFYNHSHDKKVHLDILSFYNQSAAEAEHNSEDMAIAIYDRSVLLMHLHMYKESLNDIEKSYGITKSEEMKIKFLTQKMKCMSLMDLADKEEKINYTQECETPTIHKQSKTIPCAADCITISCDTTYGRHVVATEDIKPGTIISIEKGFVLVPRKEKTYTNCSHCLMLAYNGVPCNSCAALIFCSEKCKEEAWLQYHDLECLILTYIRYNDTLYNDLAQLMSTVRLFFKFIKKEGINSIVLAIAKIRTNISEGQLLNGFFDNEIFQSDKFQSFYNLSQSINMSYFVKNLLLRPSIIQKIIKFLVEKTNVFKDYDKILNEKEESLSDFLTLVLNKLSSIVILNAFTFGENVCQCEHPLVHRFSCDTKKIDEFIAPFSSLLNHSCDENTCKLFTNNQEILFIATKSIKKGEQIFTNYGVPLRVLKVLRQYRLQERYNFTCQCQLCVNDLPADFLDKLRNPLDIDKLLATFKKAGMNEKSLKIFVGDLCNAPFDKTTIEDVIKMGQIIQKDFNSTLACVYSVNIKDYINLYYNKLYGVKFEIPNSC